MRPNFLSPAAIGVNSSRSSSIHYLASILKQPFEQHRNESARGSQSQSRGSQSRGWPYWELVALVIVLLGMIFFMMVRPGPPLGGRRPGEPIGPPGAQGPPGPAGLQGKTKTVQGLVLGFNYNPHLDYNAIRIKVDQAGTLTIDFRPHTARPVMDLATVSDSVEVTYIPHPNDEVVGYVLVSIKNDRTGKVLVLDDLPPPPDVPPNHTAEYFTIRNPALITDQYGGIVAIRNDHLLFHFKPGLVDDILPLIKSARSVGLSAVWRDDHFGFVNVNDDKVYVVLSVTIDNKTFLVR
jgi:hypothetical protein